MNMNCLHSQRIREAWTTPTIWYKWSVVLVVAISLNTLLPFSVEHGWAQGKPIGMAQQAIGSLVIEREDGILETLQGAGSLPLFETDRLKTELGNEAILSFNNGIEVLMNGDTEFRILSRWERDRPLTRILRLKKGELFVKTGLGPKQLEVETPVANAKVVQSEFNIRVQDDGETTLRVIRGIVDFGTAFNTWPIDSGAISYAVRGKKCTQGKPEDHQAAISWVRELMK